MDVTRGTARGDGRLGALAALSSSHGRAMFRVAYRIVGDSHAAEDVCQQAFAKALARPTATENPDRLAAWMIQVVVSESLQVLRRRKIERRGRLRIELKAHDRGAPASDPSMRGAIVSALQDLPEKTAAVVALRIIDGMSGNQVKDALGCSASEVSRRLHAGMESLRATLHALRSEVE